MPLRLALQLYRVFRHNVHENKEYHVEISELTKLQKLVGLVRLQMVTWSLLDSQASLALLFIKQPLGLCLCDQLASCNGNVESTLMVYFASWFHVAYAIIIECGIKLPFVVRTLSIPEIRSVRRSESSVAYRDVDTNGLQHMLVFAADMQDRFIQSRRQGEKFAGTLDDVYVNQKSAAKLLVAGLYVAIPRLMYVTAYHVTQLMRWEALCQLCIKHQRAPPTISTEYRLWQNFDFGTASDNRRLAFTLIFFTLVSIRVNFIQYFVAITIDEMMVRQASNEIDRLGAHIASSRGGGPEGEVVLNHIAADDTEIKIFRLRDKNGATPGFFSIVSTRARGV